MKILMRFFILFFSLILVAEQSQADSGWIQESLSFEFRSKVNPVADRVILDEWIEIAPFESVGVEGKAQLPAFRLIFGVDSLGVFNALGRNEVAGLTRIEAQKHIDFRASQGKSEADGAFIAGLTNVIDRDLFMFFNLTRMNGELGMAFRLITHEPLHLARYLITTFFNPSIDYFRDPYTDLKDENEEFFGETLERIATIAWDRYQKIQNPK